MPARDMAAYMRERRVRQKAERKGGHPRAAPVVDAAISRDAILDASAREMATIRAKVAAIGPGAVITKTHGRLDVLRREDFEGRDPTPTPSRAVALYNPPAPPPRSMVAIGGRPGRGLVPQGPGMPLPPDLAAVSTFTRAEEHRARTEAMLSALAAKSDDQERRLVALERAEAERRTDALGVAKAVMELVHFGLTGRAHATRADSDQVVS
jgi:hypothetical protein